MSLSGERAFNIPIRVSLAACLALSACMSAHVPSPPPASRPVLPADAAQPLGFSWRATGKMLEIKSTEYMVDERTEVSLDLFWFDAKPIQAWQYDSCVRAGICPKRELPQPQGTTTAVGMTWAAAEQFCLERGMHVQSPLAARAIYDTLGRNEPKLLDVGERDIVGTAFRCTLSSFERETWAPLAVRVRVLPVEDGRGEMPKDDIEQALREAGWTVVNDDEAEYEIRPRVHYSGFKSSLELVLVHDGKVLFGVSGGAADAIPRDELVRELGNCILGKASEALCRPIGARHKR